MRTFTAEGHLDDQLAIWTNEAAAVFYHKSDLPARDSEIQNSRRSRADVAEAHRERLFSLCEFRLGRRPVNVRLISGAGTSHNIFDLEYSDGPALVARTSVHPSAVPDFGLCVDAWVTSKLERHGLASVPVRVVDISRERSDFDYAIMEHARGTQLGDVDTGVSNELIATLGRWLRELHQIALDGFGRLDVREVVKRNRGAGFFTTWREYVLARLNEHLQLCLAIGAIDERERALAEGLFSDIDRSIRPFTPSLLHGDPGHHNVFELEGSISAVLDWEDALSGDPVFDIAFWGTFYPDSWLPPFLEGYFGSEAGAEFWHRYWLYYLRISIAKTVHRHRFGIADRPDKPPPSARIQKALGKLSAERN
jgi:aminoglycoside phosphotransferase (APT) family kinase protein